VGKKGGKQMGVEEGDPESETPGKIVDLGGVREGHMAPE